MLPIQFPESNEAYIQEGLEVPIYEDSKQTILCLQLNKEELDNINRTGKLWLRILGCGVRCNGWPAPYVKATAFNPFKKLEPLEVADHIADRVIIHQEDDEEIILYTINRREVLNLTMDFSDKVKLLGHAPDLPEYNSAIKLYDLVADNVYILKRVREE